MDFSRSSRPSFCPVPYNCCFLSLLKQMPWHSEVIHPADLSCFVRSLPREHCGRHSHGPLKMSTSWSLEPVTIVPCTAEETAMWLYEGCWDVVTILRYLGGASAVTGVFISKVGRQEGQSQRTAGFEKGGKGHRPRNAASRTWKSQSCRKPPEGTQQPCLHFDFSPVKHTTSAPPKFQPLLI